MSMGKETYYLVPHFHTLPVLVLVLAVGALWLFLTQRRRKT